MANFQPTDRKTLSDFKKHFDITEDLEFRETNDTPGMFWANHDGMVILTSKNYEAGTKDPFIFKDERDTVDGDVYWLTSVEPKLKKPVAFSL